MLAWIEEGYRPTFLRQVQAFDYSRQHQHNEIMLLETEINKLVVMGTLVKVASSSFISHCRLIPKEGGKWRLIVDLRHLNSHIQHEPCRYESFQDLKDMLRLEDWMVSFDLTAGYHHLPIHSGYRKFFTVRVGGQLYQFTELMFGLRPACRVFTKFVRPLVKFLRLLGIRIHPYLDDFLIADHRRSSLLLQRDLVDLLFKSLGLSRNVSKGVWVPVQKIKHLGLVLDTSMNLVSVPEDKVQLLRSRAKFLATYATSHRRWVSKCQLARLSGILMSLHQAVGDARFLCQRFYEAMAQGKGWKVDVKLSHSGLQDLWRIIHLRSEEMQSPLKQQEPTRVLATDASDFGWGATLDGLEASGLFDKEWVPRHINHKEMLAVILALRMWSANCKGETIRLLIDNQVSMYVIRKRASNSQPIMELFRELHELCNSHKITLVPQYIASKDNVRPDFLSRLPPSQDWALADWLWSEIVERFGPLDHDRFASERNHKLRSFNSPGKDAFNCEWTGRNFINPPFGLISRCLQKIRLDEAEAVIIIPAWYSATWWVDLMELMTDYRCLSIQETHDAVVQTNTEIPEPLRNRKWRLAVVYIQKQSC